MFILLHESGKWNRHTAPTGCPTMVTRRPGQGGHQTNQNRERSTQTGMIHIYDTINQQGKIFRFMP